METETLSIEFIDIQEDLKESRPCPVEDIVQIPVEGEKFLRVGSLLNAKVRERLVNFLLSNVDVFAWSTDDMPSINSKVASHRLRFDPKARPIKQTQRNLKGEKKKTASEEVDKLLAAGFERKVDYPDWLANVVLVKKTSRK